MGLAEVYQSDKKSAEICSQMQWDGIRFNVERAQQFSAYLKDSEARAANDADRALGRTIKRTNTGGLSTGDLCKAFFEDLGAPILFVSDLTGKPSLGAAAMQAYANCHHAQLKALASAELERRRLRKIRSTYIDPVILQVDSDSRVHPSWLNYGTVSGRWACQDPNLANLPRASTDPTADLGGVRSLYEAPPGYVFVYYDKSQIEFRVSAYGSGDEAMIRVCEGGDVHSMNAIALFGAAFPPEEYKLLKKLVKLEQANDEQKRRFDALDNLRTLAKSSVFAVCYLAEAETVYQRIISSGVPAKLSMVKAMLNTLRRTFKVYYEWQDDRLLDCIREGFTTSPILGRQRWLGHEPSPTECANFPIQSGAADIMNTEIPRVRAAVYRESPSTKLVAHVYDSVLFQVPQNDATRIKEICVAESLKPVTISSSGQPLTAVLPLDIDIAERWH